MSPFTRNRSHDTLKPKSNNHNNNKHSIQTENHVKCIEKLNYIKIKFPNFIKQSNLILDIKSLLERKFTKRKSNKINNKIIKRARKLPPCEF